MRAMLSQRIVVGMAGVGTILVTGCAQPPTEQLGAAQQAVDVAKSAGATEYEKEDFIAIEQQFALAKDELAKQEKALSIFWPYTNADKMLIKVVESSGRVAATAAQNKEAARTAALAKKKEAQQVVASATELMAKAPTEKERTTVESLKLDLSGLQNDLGVVHQSIEKDDYLGAETQARALKTKGASVFEEIQQAIEETKGKTAKVRAGTHANQS